MHLTAFRRHMSDYFKKFLPESDFDVWIVEQDDTEPFNRAWLANVGFTEAIRHAPNIQCIILHDVDLIPDMDIGMAVPYNNCTWPIRLANELEHFDWGVPYTTYVGGVTGVSAKHYRQINGMSNLFFGWGGEDDDLYWRLRLNKLLQRTRRWGKDLEDGLIMVPPRAHGTFRTISESEEDHPVKRKRSPKAEQFFKLRRKQMSSDSLIWKDDGLSTLAYLLNESSNLTVHEDTPKEFSGFASYHHIYVGWDSAKNSVTMKSIGGHP